MMQWFQEQPEEFFADLISRPVRQWDVYLSTPRPEQSQNGFHLNNRHNKIYHIKFNPSPFKDDTLHGLLMNGLTNVAEI
jgi:hypothetical protein